MFLSLHQYQHHHQLMQIHHLESFAVVVAVVVVRHLDKRLNPLLNNSNPSCHHRHLVGGTSLDVVKVVVVEYQRLCYFRHHHRHRREPIAAVDGRTLTVNY